MAFLAKLLTVNSDKQYKTPISVGDGSYGIKEFMLESPNIRVSYENSLKDGLEDMIKKYGQSNLTKKFEALDSVVSAVMNENEDAGEMDGAYISKYKNLLYWESSSPLKIDDISLKFNFGWKDWYDCKKEVWDPMVNLLAYFAPKAQDNNMLGLVPTAPLLAVKLAGYLKSNYTTNQGLANLLQTKSDSNDDSKKSNIVQKANSFISLQDSVYQAFDNAVASVLTDSKYFRLVKLRIGKFLSPAFYVGDVKAKFDWEQVDTNGYPSSGVLTLGSLSTPEMATKNAIGGLFTAEEK